LNDGVIERGHMANRDVAQGLDGQAVVLRAIRYGIPAAFIVAGQVILVATGDAVSWAGFTGAGLAILLIGFLVRLGIDGDRERDREEAARAYFAEHGEWPAERS
jgi:hypothetical protein